VLVPPCGLDQFLLPASLRGLWSPDRALALTNLPPGTPRSVSSPPRRNALVAALADAVVMIEAGLRSGTAYVVRWGLERRAPAGSGAV
jgi:DNA processing protein